MKRFLFFVAVPSQESRSWWVFFDYLVNGPPPPSRWDLIWQRVTEMLGMICRFFSQLIKGLFSVLGVVLSWCLNSPDFVAAIIVLLLICLIVLFLVLAWKHIYAVDSKGEKTVAKMPSPCTKNKDTNAQMFSFEGRDGDLLRKITIRNASCSKRIAALLEAFEDQKTEEGRVKSDLVIRTFFDETGCQFVPQNDDLWTAEKALAIWGSITSAIQALSIKGETMTPQDVLRSSMRDATGLNILVIIEKAKTVLGSLEGITEVESLEIILPRLSFAFLNAIADIPFEKLSLKMLEERAKNWERMRMIWQNARDVRDMTKKPFPKGATGRPTQQWVSRGKLPIAMGRQATTNRSPQVGVRCSNCHRFGHSARDCPLPKARALNVNEAKASEDESGSAPNGAHDAEGQSETPAPAQEIKEQEAEKEIFPDEGSSVEDESQIGSINVFEVSKKPSPFVAKKIHVSFQFQQKNKKYHSLKCLIDTGSCGNLIPLKLLRGMGYSVDDVQKNKGEPETLSGFNGSCTDTLGSITLKTRLGSALRQVTFLVVPDCIPSCILGMPALSAFDLNVSTKNRTLFFSKN